MRLRFSPAVTTVGLLLLMGLAALVIAEPFRTHLSHFEPISRLAMVLLLVTAGVAYHLLLRLDWVRRWSLPSLLAFFVVIPLLVEPLASCVLLSLLLGTYGVGRFIRERLNLEIESVAGEIAISTGLGLGGLMFVLMCLGLVGAFHSLVFAVLLVVPCLAFGRQILSIRRSLGQLQNAFVDLASRGNPVLSVVVVAAAALLLSGVITVLSPALGPDFIAFHLTAARHYAAVQALQPLEFQYYSYNPQGVEVLMTLGYSLASQPAAQMIPAMFGALLFLLIPALTRELRLDPLTACVSVVFAASLPFLHRTGAFGKNDLILGFFQFAALWCYLRARHDPNPAWLRVGVFFIAAGFGVKHVALFGAVPLGLLYLYALRSRPRRLREITIWTAVFVVFGLGWHVRTFWLTGNPVYPHSVEVAMAASEHDEHEPAGLSRVGYFRTPYAVMFEGRRFFESPSDNPMGLLFVLFGGCWLLVRREKVSGAERACLVFVGIYYLYWAAVWPTIRYAIVPIIVLGAMTSGRLTGLYDKGGRTIRGLIVSALSLGLFFSLMVVLVFEYKSAQLPFLLGRTTTEQYLLDVDPRYPALLFLGSSARRADYVYSVGNCEAAYAPWPERFDCHLAVNPPAAEPFVLAALKKRAYDFLILPNRLARAGYPEGIDSLYSLQQVHRDSQFTVFRLGKAAAETVSLRTGRRPGR